MDTRSFIDSLTRPSNDLLHALPPPFLLKWELQVELDDLDWDKTLVLTYKLSMSSYATERNYRILSRWYSCPTLFHRMDPSIPDTC